MSDSREGVEEPPEVEAITYAEFGERFFAHAVTAERITAGLRGIAGDPIEFGPIGAGPGRLAKVSATGEVGIASAEPVEGNLVAFELVIPVELDLTIDLGVDQHEFHAELEVALDLRAVAADPLRLVVEVEEPTSKNVSLNLEADGVRADLLNRVAGIDREMRRFVARFVAREIDKPHIRKARNIDVAGRINAGWRG